MGEFVALAQAAAAGGWILGKNGYPVLNDFMSFWVAGKFALEGTPAKAYDFASVHAAQITLIGENTDSIATFSYAPIFLFLMTPLAVLPYPIAFLVFVAATAALYCGVTIVITGRWGAGLFALTAPAAIVDVTAGQNGFLTAALLGAALLHLEQKPVLSGAYLGFLFYKPQFGPLFPLVLALDGRWRAFGAAALITIAALAACWLVFGFDIFPAFGRAIARANTDILVNGKVGWNKLQSLYALMRVLGIGHTPALIVHAAFALLCAAGVVYLWRRRDVPSALKASGLAAAVLLVTPFVLIYDFVVLTVAIAFLWRARAFDRAEWAVVIAANIFIAVMIDMLWPLGFLTPLAIAALIARRLLQRERGHSGAAQLNGTAS